MPVNQQSSQLRAFVAVDLPRKLLDTIEIYQRQLDREVESGQVRWTPSEQIHLTLKFYGDIASDQVPELSAALGEAARPFAPLSLSLGRLGCFPSWQRPTVIWIGVEGDVRLLQELQVEVERRTAHFGSHSEERAFHPHLTVGRVRPQGPAWRRIGEALRRESTLEKGAWRVAEIALIRSQLTSRGSIYTRLAPFPLAAEARQE